MINTGADSIGWEVPEPKEMTDKEIFDRDLAWLRGETLRDGCDSSTSSWWLLRADVDVLNLLMSVYLLRFLGTAQRPT